jgi:hypothetical protein
MIAHIPEEACEVRPSPRRRTENVKKTVEEHRVVRKVPNSTCWNIPHVTRPANVAVPIYLARRPLHALFSIRLNPKVLTRIGVPLTSHSSLFPRVHIL